MRKKLVTAVLCMSVIWTFTGCGQEGTAENSTDTIAEESSAAVTTQVSADTIVKESEIEESTQATAESASEENTAENYLPGGYAFGEEVAVTGGEEVVFGNRYKLKVGSFAQWYDGTIAMEVDVQDGDQTRHYFLHRDPEGNVGEYDREKTIEDYKLVLKDISLEGGTFTMIQRVFPEPMVLSGNPDDVYHMDDYQYVIGDKVDLFFDKDIDVSGDTLVLIEQVMSDLEEMTGLKFYNDSRYQGMNSEGTREAYFGMDPWNGYEYYNRDRVAVYFIHDREKKGLIANACGFSMVLVDEDFDFRQYSLNTLGHEMAHVLDSVNHDNFTQVITEGFGSYWGRRVSILHPEFIVGDYLEFGPDHEFYWWTQKPITAKSAEKLFNDDYDRMTNDDYYNYGFQLMTYLYENYPLDKINDFYDKLSDEIWAYRLANDEYAQDLIDIGYLGDASTPELEMEFIKSYWGQDFFEKFGAWAQENKKRFEE